MLPNRMNLTHQVEEQLKKLKLYTGITPNISARIAFFRSIENKYHYNGEVITLNGSLLLDVFTWLGDTRDITECLLKQHYPNFNAKDYHKAWAAHVEDGISALRNYKNIKEFSLAI